MRKRWLSALCALAILVAGTYPIALADEEVILPPGAEASEPVETAAPVVETSAPEPSPSDTAAENTPAEDTATSEPVPSDTPVQEPAEPPVTVGPIPDPDPVGEMTLVGLAYGSTALDGGNLKNSVGSGYRFGYLDGERRFWQVGDTAQTDISVVKTLNVWYGTHNDYTSYSDDITSDIAVGCWHVLLPYEVYSFEEAQKVADSVGGFPAWIDGSYQVRYGAYTNREEVTAAAEALGGTIVGTSEYGVSVVKTGTSTVLFQFDGKQALSLTVSPLAKEGEQAVTWFKGSRYYGAFQYRRINGGDLTISNVLPSDEYISCVVSREMSRTWPMEALKAQAVCARTYYQTNLGRHNAYGFDICPTVHCQAYYGMSQTDSRTRQAAQETAGLRAWYDDKLAETYYFSSSGGGTEDVRNVWGNTSIPYLCGVSDPYEATVSDQISYWSWTETFTAAQLTKLLQAKGYNCSTIVDLQITATTPTGNVKSITFIDSNGRSWPFAKESGVRNLLGLKSMRYTVTATGAAEIQIYHTTGDPLTGINGVYAVNGSGTVGTISGNPYVITGSGTGFLPAATPAETTGEAVFTISGSGWGHSVGMSQWGAYAMAQQGKTFQEILTFYYPGIEIR